MRTSQKCPKCEGRRFYVIDPVRRPDDDSANLVYTMHVTTLDCPADAVGSDSDQGTTFRAPVGKFEAWLCSACGYTEWYAKDLGDALARFVHQGGKGVRYVDAAGISTGPFR